MDVNNYMCTMLRTIALVMYIYCTKIKIELMGVKIALKLNKYSKKDLASVLS